LSLLLRNVSDGKYFQDSYLDKNVNDRVEVIKLPSSNSNGSAQTKRSNGISLKYIFNFKDMNMYFIIKDNDWSFENYNKTPFGGENDDAPLNLSLKSSNEPQAMSDSVLDLVLSKNPSKLSESVPTDNNLSSLQNLTAGIGVLPSESKSTIYETSLKTFIKFY
jgi:hypothetical protein